MTTAGRQRGDSLVMSTTSPAPAPPLDHVRETARQRLMDALHAEASPKWTARTQDLEEVSTRLQEVKEWLNEQDMRPGSRTPFTAEEVMDRLGYDDWKSLGIVHAALQEHRGKISVTPSVVPSKSYS